MKTRISLLVVLGLALLGCGDDGAQGGGGVDAGPAIPVIADVDGDGFPEVVINTTQETSGWQNGSIYILDGRDVSVVEKSITARQSHGRASIALGDVSGDMVPDIIFATRPTSGGESGAVAIAAVDADDNLLWTAHNVSDVEQTYQVTNAAVTTANFDDDPQAEVLVGGVLIDHTGLVVWEGASKVGHGTNQGYFGGIAVVAELDGDETPEIVTGNAAWDVSWTPGATPSDPPTVVVQPLWTAPESGSDGYPAIADFDGDGAP